MANDTKVKFDITNLNDLIKSLNKKYFVRVGIIGQKAKAEHEGNLTNAELGTFHEQPNNDGNKMPKRSFLEMPLKEKLKYGEKEKRNIKKQAFKTIFLKKKPQLFFASLGSACLEIINDAFATNGFGSWQSWSEQYKKHRLKQVKSKKKREIFFSEHNILTATGKLRNSITFKVMRNK